MSKYGFIGCGNMGGALAAAAAKAVGGTNLLLADANEEKARALAQKLGATVATNQEIAEQCDLVVLGVKPQVLAQAAAEFAAHLAPHTLVVSMAAGVTLETLGSLLGPRPLIRIMPNTPVQVGEGRILCKFTPRKSVLTAPFPGGNPSRPGRKADGCRYRSLRLRPCLCVSVY